MPLLNLRQVRPDAVVDINRVPGLEEIRITPEVVRIGSMTRLRAIEQNRALRELVEPRHRPGEARCFDGLE